MGLDQYAYSAAKAGQYSEFYETAEFDRDSLEYVNSKVNKPKEIAYWRKHPNLHGWMEQLWINKGHPNASPDDMFNGIELELTWEDLELLEDALLERRLPATSGFFFGNDSDDEYLQHDLQFIREAKADLFCGLKVFYNSSW